MKFEVLSMDLILKVIFSPTKLEAKPCNIYIIRTRLLFVSLSVCLVTKGLYVKIRRYKTVLIIEIETCFQMLTKVN